MSGSKAAIPKGTRDFSPQEVRRREYIFESIKSVFHLYGYQPIETPAMEKLSTLMGKYGEEGDKLLFKILNSGDFLSGVAPEDTPDSVLLAGRISEKGLRYDLTVPFARYVVQHRDELVFPFRRYQIQPVWRADRPQKGRYREFFQCDADVIGSDSLMNEVELLFLVNEVFGRLGIPVQIKINNRKILAGIARMIGEPERLTEITVAIDKLEKIGRDKVVDELKTRGLSEEAVNKLSPVFDLQGTNTEKLSTLEDLLADIPEGIAGIQEMREILVAFEDKEIQEKVEIDLTLARGLNYYTGAIIEVKALDVDMGSICGGGRYDNLTGVFGMPGLSGVGISFGAERIYDVLVMNDGFPAGIEYATKVFFVNFGEKEQKFCLDLVMKLRGNGVSAELYPDQDKMKKQMNYANRKNIPFVVLVGEEEMNAGLVTLKNMTTGEQQKLSPDQLLTHFVA